MCESKFMSKGFWFELFKLTVAFVTALIIAIFSVERTAKYNNELSQTSLKLTSEKQKELSIENIRLTAAYQREQIMWTKFSEFVDAAFAFSSSIEFPTLMHNAIAPNDRYKVPKDLPIIHKINLPLSKLIELRRNWDHNKNFKREQLIVASSILMSYLDEEKKIFAGSALNRLLEICNTAYSLRDCVSSDTPWPQNTKMKSYCYSVIDENIPDAGDIVRNISIVLDNLYLKLSNGQGRPQKIDRQKRSTSWKDIQEIASHSL